MSADAHVSHFGALKVASTIPVLKGNFPGTTLDTKQWNAIADNGGSIAVGSGVADLVSGTGSTGTIKLASKQRGIFEAGQVTVYQAGVRAGEPVASNIRRWGLMSSDETNGLFFELNGTDFRVVARHNGVDTAVEQSSFNGETTFTPGDTNNTYRIHYSAGRAIFARARQGKLVTLHTMVDSALPLVSDLDMGLYFENTNSGNTNTVEMRIRGASSSVFGQLQRFNRGNALVTTSFETEVALDNVSEYETGTKFGRNSNVGTATVPEDLWNGGDVYTGFNATANEDIEVFSANAADSGVLESTGSATSSSFTSLIDSTADFVSDGVTVGDLVINDTQRIHGVVTSVATTSLGVARMVGGERGSPERNNVGDSYRVASPGSTGAAVIRIEQLLDADYAEQSPQYVILNGTTGVTVTGNYMRCTRASTIIAGSGGGNAGTVTIRQATTTANVFAVMPTTNQTTIGAFTVPAEKVCLIRRVRAAITRASGAAGSATINLLVRRRGEVFRAVRVFEVQTGAPTEFTSLGGIVVAPGSDIKFRIQDVSDNSTIVDGAFEYLLVEE